MRSSSWLRLAVGAVIGLLLGLAVAELTDVNRVTTTIDPNRNGAVLSVRVLGAEIHRHEGQLDEAEASTLWATGGPMGCYRGGSCSGLLPASESPQRAPDARRIQSTLCAVSNRRTNG